MLEVRRGGCRGGRRMPFGAGALWWACLGQKSTAVEPLLEDRGEIVSISSVTFGGPESRGNFAAHFEKADVFGSRQRFRRVKASLDSLELSSFCESIQIRAWNARMFQIPGQTACFRRISSKSFSVFSGS